MRSTSISDLDHRPNGGPWCPTIRQRFESRLPIRLTRRLESFFGGHVLSAELGALGRLGRREICRRSVLRGWELLAENGRVVLLPAHGLPILGAAIIGSFARPSLVVSANARASAGINRYLELFEHLDIETVWTTELSSKAPPILAANGVVLLVDDCDDQSTAQSPTQRTAKCLEEIASVEPPLAAVCQPLSASDYRLDLWEPAVSTDSSVGSSNLKTLELLYDSLEGRQDNSISESS